MPRLAWGNLPISGPPDGGRTKLYDFKLSMSTYYDMTDKQAKSCVMRRIYNHIAENEENHVNHRERELQKSAYLIL